MKQTAVQWLMPKILELNLQLSLRRISQRNCELEILRLFDKALEMEKEQIMNSWLVDGYTDLTDENWKKEFEEYYKETYETQND